MSTKATGLAFAWLAMCVLGLLAGPAEAGPSTADEATQGLAAEASGSPVVRVIGIGPVTTAQLRAACQSLEAEYPVRCEVDGITQSSEYADLWNEERHQLDARATLERMFRRKSARAHIEVALTAHDLYEGRRPYVFGLASLTDRVAVVSVARVIGDAELFPARLRKLVHHEVGHAMGLPHHEHQGCVMRSDPTVSSLDSAPERPCARCHQKLRSRSKTLSRPGQIALDLTKGHLVRGETEQARVQATAALGSSSASVLVDVGKAFLKAAIDHPTMQASLAQDAIGILELSLTRDPNHPQAHVSLALALELRGGDHDLDEALVHFDRALTLRPQWHEIAKHTRSLRAMDTPRAQGGD